MGVSAFSEIIPDIFGLEKFGEMSFTVILALIIIVLLSLSYIRCSLICGNLQGEVEVWETSKFAALFEKKQCKC